MPVFLHITVHNFQLSYSLLPNSLHHNSNCHRAPPIEVMDMSIIVRCIPIQTNEQVRIGPLIYTQHNIPTDPSCWGSFYIANRGVPVLIPPSDTARCRIPHTVSNKCKFPGQFRLQLNSKPDRGNRSYHTKSPAHCKSAGFTSKNRAIEHHNFACY